VHLRWCGWALAACLLVGALACNGTTAAGTLVHGPTVIEAPGTYLLGGNLSVPGGPALNPSAAPGDRAIYTTKNTKHTKAG